MAHTMSTTIEIAVSPALRSTAYAISAYATGHPKLPASKAMSGQS